MATSIGFWRRRAFELAIVGICNPHRLSHAATTLPAVDLSTQIQQALLSDGQIDAIASKLPPADPKTPQTLRDRIQVEVEQGRLNDAVGHLKQLAILDPKNAGVLDQLADVEDLTGDTPAAVQTLQALVQMAGDRTSQRLKLATLLLDEGSVPQGLQQLDLCIAADPALAQRAGILAGLFGQSAASAKYLRGVLPSEVSLKMLEGNAALDAGNAAQAAGAFTWALDHTADASERSYLYERVIATARQNKTLAELADHWMSQPDRPADQLYPLATVLRELGRSDLLLTLWRDSAANPKYSAVALSSNFVSEVLSAAIAAGQTDKALAVCREMTGRNPDDAGWMMTTVRVLLKTDKPEDADALLLAQLQKFRPSPADLQRVGRFALSLGRYAVVQTAAKDLIDLGNGNAISGQLLQAEADQQSGDRPSAQALLRQTATAAVGNSVPFSDIASALDGAGLIPEEISFLQGYVAKQNDGDAAEWLATLLSQHDRGVEAMNLLDHLRNSADSPALRSQASQRLLAIAGQTHQLQKLIDRLQPLVDSSSATEDDLGLLTDAYVMANHTESAAEAIKKTSLYGPTEKLHRLYILYLRTQRFDLADGALHELLIAEPDNALETLEQITTIALQRKQSAEAVDAMRQIKQRVDAAGDSSLDFLGDFYDRVGYPAQAATYYRRAIALHPDNAENWLLWASQCTKAGDGERAGERLQLLCIQAKDDNTFTVAADGLLNLNMPPAALQAARRQAALRLAAAPQSMILYHVIGDLCEELQDTGFATRAIKMSLPQSRDERPQQLRELMESASRAGAVDAAVTAGRSLIAIGDEFPPGLFLDLGEQLLRVNRLEEADRALDRAAEVSGSDATIISRIADLYQKYGFADRALTTLKPLTERFRNDSAFCEQLAKLHDIIGRHDLAFDEYLTVLNLNIDAAERAGPEKEGGIVAAPGVVISTASSSKSSLGPTKVVRALTQAMVQARTSEQQSRLLNLLVDRLKSAEANPRIGNAPPKPVAWLSSQIRKTCFALNKPDVADQTDRDLLKRWPGDLALKQACVSQRMDSGLYSRAAQFTTECELPLPQTILSLQELEANPQASTQPAAITVESAVKILPALVARGQLDEAKLIIKALPRELSDSQLNALPVLTAAAFAVGDSDALLSWTLCRIDLTVATIRMPLAPSHVAPVTSAASAGPGAGGAMKTVLGQSFTLSPKSYPFQKAVAGTWPMLSSAGQLAVLRHLSDLALHHPNPAVRNDAAILSLRLGVADPSALANRNALVQQVGVGAVADISRQCQLFALLTDADRPAFIEDSLKRLPANMRLRFVLRVVAQTCEPIDAASQAFLVDAAAAASTAQWVDWRPWFSNLAQAQILPALANAVVKESGAGLLGDSPAPLVAAAIAQYTGGDRTASDQTSASAIHKLISWRGEADPDPSTPKNTDLLRFAVAVLSPQARTDLLREIEPLPQAVSARAVLLQANGQQAEALNLLRSGFSRNPNDVDTAWLYLQTLTTEDRLQEIADVFSPRLLAGKFSKNDSKFRQKVAGVLQQLHRTSEATKILEQDDTQIVDSRGDLPWDLGNHDKQQLSQYVRLRLQKWDRPPDPFPVALSDQWSSCPESYDDLLAILRTAAASGNAFLDLRALPWTEALVQNAKNSGQIDSLLHMLSQAQIDLSLNKIDRLILRSLAMIPGISLPQPLKDELWRSAFAGESSATCELYATALEAQSDPRAPAMELWVSSLAQTGDAVSTIVPMDSPMNQVSDPAAVSQLMTLIYAGHLDEAETKLRRNRRFGRVTPQDLGCGLVWARLAAERGQMDLFSQRFEQVFSAWKWSPIDNIATASDPILLELQQILSVAGLNSRVREQIRNTMEKKLADKNLTWPLQMDRDFLQKFINSMHVDVLPGDRS